MGQVVVFIFVLWLKSTQKTGAPTTQSARDAQSPSISPRNWRSERHGNSKRAQYFLDDPAFCRRHPRLSYLDWTCLGGSVPLSPSRPGPLLFGPRSGGGYPDSHRELDRSNRALGYFGP